MSSYITKNKGIRIKNECFDYFQGKPLNRMVESLQGLLESGRVKFDGQELIICENFSKKSGSANTTAAPFFSSADSNSSTSSKKESSMSIDLDNEIGKDLIQMLNLSKKSPSEFVKDAHGLLESGSLIYENGKLRVEVGFDYDPFLEFCRKHNARPKKVFENIMEEIYKEFGRN